MDHDKRVIKGAREHNLKGIYLELPRNRLIVITGLSGSGKSSLAFDTLYAEGQRRYVESLSTYARQFLGVMEKPDVDVIEGLSPAVSIEQRKAAHNPRSTVGTVTEIYDYLRLFFARVGEPFCYRCGRPIRRQSVERIVETILRSLQGSCILVLAPLVRGKKGEYRELFRRLQGEGFVRVRVDGSVRDLDRPLRLSKTGRHRVERVIDRLQAIDRFRGRIEESVDVAMRVGDGLVQVGAAGTVGGWGWRRFCDVAGMAACWSAVGCIRRWTSRQAWAKVRSSSSRARSSVALASSRHNRATSRVPAWG